MILRLIKKNTINYMINKINSFSKKKIKSMQNKTSIGYDVTYLKKYKEKENKGLNLNLKITFNWYNSKNEDFDTSGDGYLVGQQHFFFSKNNHDVIVVDNFIKKNGVRVWIQTTDTN